MIILFIISLFLCIILHELAHLFAAKLVNCKVEIFSIGFGRAIFKKKIGQTIYQIGWLPLGGYNKLKDECSVSKDKDSFSNLKYRDKLIIISAGCLINIIFGLISLFFARIVVEYNPLIIYYHNYELFYFGCFSLLLGIGNFLPFPSLDGFYPFGILLENFYGKEKGNLILNKLNHIGFIILMVLNILCILLFIWFKMMK